MGYKGDKTMKSNNKDSVGVVSAREIKWKTKEWVAEGVADQSYWVVRLSEAEQKIKELEKNSFVLNAVIVLKNKELQNYKDLAAWRMEQYKKYAMTMEGDLLFQKTYPVAWLEFCSSGLSYSDWLFDFVMEQGGLDNEKDGGK